MVVIPGYKIEEQVFVSYNSTIYRGKRDTDGIKVIIKLLNDEYPSIDKLTGFRREYEITNRLSGEKIIKMYELINNKNGLLMVMEDFGGKSLAHVIKNGYLNLDDKLFLAVNIIDALSQIHSQGIIHKDINPYNIIWNSKTNQLKIIDFGISSELSKEKPQRRYVLEGTIPYISPEQTGKVNRIIDYRSDLYSLGIVLYELLTGKLPFSGDDLEIVHGHIAKMPDEPKKLNSKIPSAISDIIMKLISKNAEDRYQSTFGLKYDLEYCIKNCNVEGVFEFAVGGKDMYDKFQIQQKLYGREKEIEILTKSVDSLCDNQSGLLLVSGYSGIGKTSIIHEVIKTITTKEGFFISGKFDQLERNNPYSAIISAFSGLIKNLVIEYKDMDIWRKKLVKVLGKNTKLMFDLIPELNQLIGECEDVPKLNPTEEKNRFQMVFKDFVSVFASKEHPLVIFLDDLQWSDLSTIELLKYLLSSTVLGNLLIIGAYRDNEVKYGHPLLTMIGEINKVPKNVCFMEQFYLEPLEMQTVNELIADTLRCSSTEVSTLTSYIYQKTKGNPFFTNHLLISLYQKGVFQFNEEKCRWDWSLEAVKEVEVSDNVAEFLIKTIGMFPQDSLKILMSASCISNEFSLRLLYSINDKSENVSNALWTAMRNDLIIPVDNNYRMLYLKKDEYLKSDTEVKFRFCHDRIRDAIYSIIPENERVLIHKSIGYVLLKSIKENPGNANGLFEVTNHLNAAKNSIKDKHERIELLSLNIEAGKRSRSNAAYNIANNYFKKGMDILSSDEWSEYPDKLFRLSYDYTESLYLTGNIEDAITECGNLIKIATNDIDRSKVYELKSNIYLCKGENVNIVIDELKKGLQLLNIVLPDKPEEIEMQVGGHIGKMMGYLAANPIDGLIDLPKMTDESKIAAMNLLFQAAPPAIQSYPPLFMLIEMIMLDMAINYGTTEVSCKNFVDLGIIHGSILGNYEAGYKFGETAFKLIDKYKAESLKPSVCFVFSEYVSHWRAHYSENLKYFDKAIETGLATGDMLHTCYTSSYKALLNLYTGKNLSDCFAESENIMRFLVEAKAELLVFSVEINQYIIKWLQTGANNNEETLFKKVMELQNLFISLLFGIVNTMTYYLMGDFESAEKWSAFTEPYIPAGMGHFFMVDHTMFQTLLLIRKWEKASEDEKDKIMEMIVKNREALKIWADNCSVNFAHKYYLVCGEIAVIQKESLEEITGHYNKALNSIAQGDFVHMKALITELLGKFWLKRGESIIATAFIKEAHYLYTKWGADYKAANLEKEYPNVAKGNIGNIFSGSYSKNTMSTVMGTVSLDFMSVLKSTQVISNEIKIDKLLKVLMNTLIENACAQNGCIILKNNEDDKLYVKAVKRNNTDEIEVLNSIPIVDSSDFCLEIVQHVNRTKENVVLDNACEDHDYVNNKYIKSKKIISIICLPIIYQNNLKGVIYLENNLTKNAFNIDRIEVLKILSSQIAISIENAELYENLEEKVIERTKQLQEKNEHIMESITYAKIIQMSILPLNDNLKQCIRDHFVLWRPRDTVGGDIYWFNQSGDNYIVGLIDCTGHGVPGAFMTMTANSVLNRIAGEISINDPAKMLVELNRYVRITLNHHVSNGDLSDYDNGMDIGLCYIMPLEKKMIYAGAKIPLYFCKNDEITVINADKQGVGYRSSLEDFKYTNHEIKLTGNETFYLTSDGYVDQRINGGEFGLGKNRFKKLLSENYTLPLEQQKVKFESLLDTLQGDEIQTDDITVIGLSL